MGRCRSAKPRCVNSWRAAKGAELLVLLAIAITQDAFHRRLGVVENRDTWQTAEKLHRSKQSGKERRAILPI